MANVTAELPVGLRDALSGENLEADIGRTLLVLAVGDDDWPRIATVSVGEVFAPDERTVLLSLYATSRTTAAITSTGRALLLTDADGAIVRVRLATALVEDADAAGSGRVVFRGAVVGVEIDAVPYARVTHGIGFELLDPAAALERWQRQLDGLKALR
jgi:hypothetical protein